MTLIELFLLAVGLSMDAFAISICIGLTTGKATIKRALVAGLYFGVSQAVMPLAGYFAASLLAERVIDFGYWIAFGVLAFLGAKMIYGCIKDEQSVNRSYSLSPAHMLPLAVATSIDALAVGVSFAFIRVSIVPAVLFIGATTLAISMAGVKIGSVFGERFKKKALLAGGVILVLIGLKILLEHLFWQ